MHQSHRLAWQKAKEAMREDADLKWVLIVEDDCVPCLHPAAESQWSAFYGPAWQVAWRHIAKAMESCGEDFDFVYVGRHSCLLYTSPSPRDGLLSRMPSSA